MQYADTNLDIWRKLITNLEDYREESKKIYTTKTETEQKKFKADMSLLPNYSHKEQLIERL